MPILLTDVIRRRCILPVAPLLMALAAAACGADQAQTTGLAGVVAPPVVLSANTVVAVTVGSSVFYDASKGGTAFSDPAKKGLTYRVDMAGSTGLVAVGCELTGIPLVPGTIAAIVTATDANGRTASDQFTIVVFAAGLPTPALPLVADQYAVALPQQYLLQGIGGSVAGTDNTPSTNPVTNAGAALGRVLFHDPRLSGNDRLACASCHIQSLGFSDTARLSTGFKDGLTKRHAMGLANARFYQRGRFFWDERAATLEDQVLGPIQDTVEMGMTLEALALKLAATTYYKPLFTAAFGTTDITTDRISKALAQYVRSFVSASSKFDRAFTGGGQPNFAAAGFTAQEQQGEAIFRNSGCVRCHATNGQVSDDIHNTGLDATITDVGAGGGRFKAPSLRSVAVRAPYMHDGRFKTLDEVVAFYNTGVQNNPNLDNRLRGPGGVQRLGLSGTEQAALVAFMRTLTDSTLLTASRFSSPFK
ncbi:MAG: cytochrome c peroxidase [Gemmatimonadaceae bacterium]